MKVLIINTDYPTFLQTLYAANRGLATASYNEQLKTRMDSLFGVADFYSSNLRQLGHEAIDICVNNENIQKAWATEHGLKVSGFEWELDRRRGIIPFALRRKKRHWMYGVLATQIKYYKPDILLNQAMDGIPSSFFKEMKPNIRLLVGQHAAPMPHDLDYSYYDLFISSLPNYCEYFRKIGIKSELNRLAFEPRVLQRLNGRDAAIPISFVGSLGQEHSSRTLLLEMLCNQTCIRVWGNDGDFLSKDLTISQRLENPVWGLDMYRILQRSQITLNHHIGISESYANNMRLYEATGVGTLLITDWKQNIHEMFDVGKEVVVYRSPEECLELINYYLSHPDEAETIARAGQKRTLRDHTYAKRMEEFIEIVSKVL